MKADCGLDDLDGLTPRGQLDVLARGVLDPEDRRLLHADAAVGQRPVRTDEVDRAGLGDAEREREAGIGRLALEGHPEVLGPREHVLGTVERHGLDGRDVERELQRVADPDRASLEVVGIGRRVATTEVGRDVHQHVAGGERAVVDADGVVERLERRTRLAEALGHDVVLRLELRVVRRRVVVRRADVGHDLAGLVVHRDERPVADVLVLEVAHPGGVLVEAEPAREPLRVAVVRGDGRRLDPLLGDLLETPVEGRGDAEAAFLERRAGRRVGSADLPRELLPGRPTRSAVPSRAASSGGPAPSACPSRPRAAPGCTARPTSACGRPPSARARRRGAGRSSCPARGSGARSGRIRACTFVVRARRRSSTPHCAPGRSSTGTAAAPRGSPPRLASARSSDLPKYDWAAAFTP